MYEDTKILVLLKKYKVDIYYDLYMLPNYQLYVNIKKRHRVKEYLSEEEWIILKDWLDEDYDRELKAKYRLKESKNDT